MEMENMTRGHSWRFLDIGRRLERASNIATIIQGALKVESASVGVLEPVLEIADSVMTYRRRYFARPLWPPVLDLLLADETNPRSLAFQINALADHVANLPREGGRGRGRETRQIDALRGLLNSADLPALVQEQLSGRKEGLNVLLARIAAELRGISDSLNHQYFSHAAAQVS
jgi:uncharacterized alpha-E superfamily protein